MNNAMCQLRQEVVRVMNRATAKKFNAWLEGIPVKAAPHGSIHEYCEDKLKQGRGWAKSVFNNCPTLSLIAIVNPSHPIDLIAFFLSYRTNW